tara:strand:- start:85 stop:471 length:387 start_codon:yes stop_codon:yes gene_type:complete
MIQDFYVEIALDINKHFYQEKKSFLLTLLPTIGDGDWYSYHDTERRQRKFIYKEIYCIRLSPNSNTVIQLISLVKREKGIFIECIYTNNQLIYASNYYSKLMNKDKIKELKERTMSLDEKRILVQLNC